MTIAYENDTEDRRLFRASTHRLQSPPHRYHRYTVETIERFDDLVRPLPHPHLPTPIPLERIKLWTFAATQLIHERHRTHHVDFQFNAHLHVNAVLHNFVTDDTNQQYRNYSSRFLVSF